MGFFPITSKQALGSVLVPFEESLSQNNTWRRETVRSVVMHPEPLPNTVLEKGFSSTLEPSSPVISIDDESAFELF